MINMNRLPNISDDKTKPHGPLNADASPCKCGRKFGIYRHGTR
jgi:hypothetical protein